MKTRTNQPVYKDNGEELKDSDLSGGTKLYRHNIVFSNADEIIFINNVATPYTFDNLQNLVNAIYLSLKAVFHNETKSADQVIMTAYLVGEDLDMAVFESDSLGFSEVEKVESDFENVTDSITPL